MHHTTVNNDPKIIVALDYACAADALALADRLQPELCAVKVGMELFTAEGPALVKELVSRGFRVFLDLKFHDIPHTVAQALKASARLGVWMVNVHASGGPAMLKAAAEALKDVPNRPILIAVTVLTSMNEQELAALGLTGITPKEQVLRLAKLTRECGLDGVVSSAQEAALIKAEIEQPFVNVTPGIRPAGAALGDQKRVMTPREALQAGSDYLVIGRPITQAADPLAALKSVLTEIEGL